MTNGQGKGNHLWAHDCLGGRGKGLARSLVYLQDCCELDASYK